MSARSANQNPNEDAQAGVEVIRGLTLSEAELAEFIDLIAKKLKEYHDMPYIDQLINVIDRLDKTLEHFAKASDFRKHYLMSLVLTGQCLLRLAENKNQTDKTEKKE